MIQTIARRLSEFSDNLRYEDIPAEVIAKAKHLVLDTVGVCMGSTRIGFGTSALDLASRWGGAAEASVIGQQLKVPVHHAAFANGILGHGQDYDDTHTESVVHGSAALVPAALAVAEYRHSSGREMLTAFVAGLEAAIRIALPAFNRFHLRGFHTTSLAATFGSALIAARLDGAGLERTVDAVGVSGSFASGLLECVPAGSGAKRVHAGWSALCGIVATQLATAGYSGPDTVFEGKLGLYNSFLRGESVDLNIILEALGRRWHVLDVRPKLYPCCHYLQSFIDGAAKLRREQQVHPSDIQSISCRVAQGAVNIVCEPWEKKLAPISAYDTRFSLPFAVATMLVRGKAGNREFSEESAADSGIREMMSKVTYAVEPAYQTKNMPGSIEVVMKNRMRHFVEIPEVRGDARNPIALEELMSKFQANTSFMEAAARSQIAKDILSLDELADVGSLMARLAAI